MAELNTLGAPIRAALEGLTGEARGELLLALVAAATPTQRAQFAEAIGAVRSEDVDRIDVVTQAEHDALSPPDPRTLYVKDEG